ncbi:predicted protein [Thalassiosira pseudonana CCMP1335]|uniref:Uncharacterized protein n=1 Tax=Thalassiosira pseudonana TaxID=35128 RepID=B8LEJ1_THAPS|nr:predicted protein [Thalassiosira pseudonana CCMP1335]EED86256.1 predicted protein [Thalassiosira pseudonana CCMP1335]|eukprot:g13130.t1 g13130   contig70:86429-87140(+)
MLSSLARTASRLASTTAPTVGVKAATARFGGAAVQRWMSVKPFAVDAPDGDHDLQDLEESSTWAKRTIDVASVTEDADAINAIHNAVLGGGKVFAVDAPDGEHDLEDVEEHMAGVKSIINEASIFENPDEVKAQQILREEVLKEAIKTTQHDL